MGLTEITFIPIWFADLWRAVLWIAMVIVLSHYAAVLPLAWAAGSTWRRASVFGATALAVFMVSGVMLTAENLGHHAVFEITPLYTLGVFLAFMSARCLAREHGHERPGLLVRWHRRRNS